MTINHTRDARPRTGENNINAPHLPAKELIAKHERQPNDVCVPCKAPVGRIESRSHYTGEMFYGWVIVFVSMVAVAATSPGQSYLIGKLNAPIEADLGIKETTLTAVYGFATLAAALLLPAVGRLADRWGPRRVMGLSALTLGGGCVLMGFARGPLALAACYFLLRFAGQGALGLSASHSTAMWFERRLGTATGIKSFAMPLAMLVLAPLTTWLIHQSGWRAAYALLGVGVCATVLPLVALLHRNRPEDFGQLVDGERVLRNAAHVVHPHAHADAELIASAAQVPAPLAMDLVDDSPTDSRETCFTRTEAMSTAAFWIIAIAMTLNSLVGTAFVFLMSKLADSAGLPESSADLLLGVFAVGSALCAPLAGILTDRVRPRWLLSSGTAMLAVACGSFALADSLLLAQFAMVCLAASQTLIFISGGTLSARFYGRAHHGAIRGTLALLTVLGTALGPFVAVWTAQRLAYSGTLWLFAALAVIIAFAGLGLQQPTSTQR